MHYRVKVRKVFHYDRVEVKRRSTALRLFFSVFHKQTGKFKSIQSSDHKVYLFQVYNDWVMTW